METSVLLAYIVSVTLLVATPGPVVALVINTSISRGPKDALLTALGTNWASLLLISLAALVISGVMTINQKLISWLSVAGCLFIAYIAIDSLRDLARNKGTSQSADSHLEQIREQGGGIKGFSKGFLVAISNPKDIIFFVAFFPQFIAITDTFVNSIATLVALWIAIDLSILCSYIYVMQNKIAKNYQRPISFMSSLALLSIAVIGMLYTLLSQN